MTSAQIKYFERWGQMKLYITAGRQIPNSYTGIDITRQKVDFANMDSVCEASECNEMVLDEMLSYVKAKDIFPLLQQVVTRLRKGGKLIIKDVVLTEATKMYQNGLIGLEDINSLLFGTLNLNKSGAYSHMDIQQGLKAMGLEVISIDLKSCYYTLVLKRN